MSFINYAGIILLFIGLLWTVFKGYVVWTIAHDGLDGGGAPTLDFPIFCPAPLSMGLTLVLAAHHATPFPGFGFVCYLVLAALFGILLWVFDILGRRKRRK